MLGFDVIGGLSIGSGYLVPTPIFLTIANPTQVYAVTALRKFLLTFLPSGVSVILGQVNRVPEPVEVDYVVMTPLRRRRLSTNESSLADCRFYGSINGTVMTVAEVSIGAILLGATIFGPGVQPGTKVTSLIDSEGDVGTYTVSPGQQVEPSVLSSGAQTLLEHTQLTIQLDVHGPDGSDNAQLITTALRDAYAFDWLAANYPGVAPLFADEARQVPFLNAEKQYEDRWSIDAELQVNPALAVPQQFADEVSIVVAPIEAVFPARS